MGWKIFDKIKVKNERRLYAPYYADRVYSYERWIPQKQDLIPAVEKRMRSHLINKNLCFYYWLRKRIGKKPALSVATGIERTILIFGREVSNDKIREVIMNKNGKLFVIALTFLFLTTYGCAFGTRHVKLNPMKTSLAIDATGQSAFVEVIDKRDPALKPVVGHVKNTYGMKTAEVVADKEVSIWVRDIVADELKRSGASVMTDGTVLDNNTAKITLDVLVFYAQAYMRYGGEVTVALTVTKNNKRIVNEKTYTGKATLGMNWGASSESYQKVLELAMEEMLKTLMPDIITAIKS